MTRTTILAKLTENSPKTKRNNSLLKTSWPQSSLIEQRGSELGLNW